ncbi:MAG: carboxypeptidase regulatory-like domain-containing protein [Blastocatellia bacterium]|nr:carboxypeptidase regulatory-like domain-containing protein [Blastocatellia bacterium]
MITNRKKFDVNALRVASPCSMGWEKMTGDERVRHCHSCQMSIYNTAEMTKGEVEQLILSREGRLCIRLHKRADGTVMTKDCPVGLRAYQKRAARFAGATLTAILGFFSVSFGQENKDVELNVSDVKIVKEDNQAQKTKLIGRILDIHGAVVPGAELRLYAGKKKKPLKSRSDVNGDYVFSGIEPGTYRLKIKSPGFSRSIYENIAVKQGLYSVVNVELQPAGVTVTVGIYGEEPLIDITSSSVTTVITPRKIESIPH